MSSTYLEWYKWHAHTAMSRIILLPTTTPTTAATVVFGMTFLYSLVRAVRHIRRREVALHREWMIRMFSLALAVATIRAVQGLAQAFLGASLEETFGASFWIAFTLNLGIAEMWIRFTRSRSRSIPAAAGMS